jgi:hypothetical protein
MMESGPFRVLCGQTHTIRSGLKFGMPTLEIASELTIERAGSNLQLLVRATWSPPHLLLFDEPLADNLLVDGGLHESSRDRLTMSVTIGVVRDGAAS